MSAVVHNGVPMSDAAALSWVQGQAYRVNATVYEARYPNWDYPRLIYVDTTGPEWSPGVITYTSDISGKAKFQSGYAKDVPMADVSQSQQLQTFHLAAIGYQWNIEEINTTLNLAGASLPDRRARAARMAAEKFLFDTTLAGQPEKGLTGLINQSGVITLVPAADGTGGVPYWVNAAGTGTKTPAQIVRDINRMIMGISIDTYGIVLADTLLLPEEAYNYIAATPYSATTMETILSFVLRTNLYTLQTGQQLTIRTVRELSTAATTSPVAGDGRAVAYNNDPAYVKLHLPMPFRFLGVYQDGPLNWTVPGIFRTGGVELLTTAGMRYMDGVSEPRNT